MKRALWAILALFVLVVPITVCAGIESWDTTPANNNSTPPAGAPEGMAPSTVNDTIRQIMADVRAWYEAAEWIDLGYTTTYVSATSFTIAADVTTAFTAGRRLKTTNTGGTIYSTIVSSSYSSPDTTITVVNDSGSLDSGLSVASLGILHSTNRSHPAISARVYNSAAFSTTHNTADVVTFDSERWDTAGIHSTSSNTSRLTAPVTGTYLVVGNLGFAASNTTGYRNCSIILNGTTTTYWASDEDKSPSASRATFLTCTSIMQLTATDYVELQVFQNSGGAVDVFQDDNNSPEFSITLLD